MTLIRILDTYLDLPTTLLSVALFVALLATASGVG